MAKRDGIVIDTWLLGAFLTLMLLGIISSSLWIAHKMICVRANPGRLGIHASLLHQIGFLQNEPHGCAERPEESSKLRVYDVHKVSPERLSYQHH